jgi:hypothetical protein
VGQVTIAKPNYYRRLFLPSGWPGCVKSGQLAFDSATAFIRAEPLTDKKHVKIRMPILNKEHSLNIPWAMQMKAVSTEDPSRLVQSLTGAILGCGGWVLSRGTNDTGRVNMLFEFERHACVDIYTLLIAAGVELSQIGHFRLTELCQCTRSQPRDCGAEIASLDLEIQTFPPEVADLMQFAGPA